MVTPARAAARCPGSPGYHWYLVPRVGYPDPATFHAAYEQLAELHDELWRAHRDRARAHGPRRLLDGRGDELRARPRAASARAPAGILAFSGFIPTVEGWQPDLASRAGLPVFIAHGARDPVIEVELRPPRRAELLEAGGLAVDYHESEAAHHIDPRQLPRARRMAGAGRLPRRRRAAPEQRRREAHKVGGAAGNAGRRGARMSAAAVDTGALARRDLEVLIVGAGFGGIAAAIELRRHGIQRHHDPREGARPRRHLVLQQLPGRRLRRPQPPVLVLLRPAPRLVAAVLAAGGDPRLPARGRARPRRRAPDQHRQHGHRLHAGTSSAAAGRVQTARRATATRPTRSILATGQLHQPARSRGSRARRRSPATASTRPNGTTTTSSRASAWRSSAPAPAPSSSSPRSRPRVAQLTRLPAHRQLVPAAQEPALPAPRARPPSSCIPGLQALRGAGSSSSTRESLTLGDPPPAHVRAPRGRCARPRSCARSCEDPRAARARPGPTTPSAASGSCSAPTSCRRSQRPNVELVTEPIARIDARRAS